MQRISLIDRAHDILRDRLRPGDVAVDATVGNGYDTLFLLQCIAPTGMVYGFDIQAKALDSARSNIQQTSLSDCLTLFHGSHAFMAERIPPSCHGQISGCMFNLGYLPGSDKTVFTKSESTLAALTAASMLLSASGIMTIIAYPGHSGGEQETEQVKLWCDRLNTGLFYVSTLLSDEHNESAPRLFVVSKTLAC